MRKRLLLGIVTLVAAGAVAVPALADSPNAAQKEPFFNNPAGNCLTGAIPGTGTPTDSFAVIKQNGNGTVSAEVSLKNEFPNATYPIFIVQTPSGTGCQTPVGTVQTDGLGRGNGRFSVPIAPGTTDAFVYTFHGDATLITPDYVFGNK